MGLWVFDLRREKGEGSALAMGGRVGKGDVRVGEGYFYFKEILGRAVDLFEALLTGIGHGLHVGQYWWG